MKCCFITVVVLVVTLGLTLFLLLSKKDDDLSTFEELEEITVESVDDCQFDKKMNNSLWSLHKKNEKSYYKAIGYCGLTEVITFESLNCSHGANHLN